MNDLQKVDGTTGKVLDKFDMPCSEMTSVAFGGPDFDELFVTSIYKPDQPLCGSLFRLTGLGVKGSNAAEFVPSSSSVAVASASLIIAALSFAVSY